MALTWTKGAEGRYRYSGSVGSGLTSDPLFVGAAVCSVAILPAGGASGRLEYTMDDIDAVNGATATWIAWPHGAVTANTADVIQGPVTAIRAVSVSGIINWRALR